VVAHTLTTINVQAGVAAHLLDRDPSHAEARLAAIEAASHDALDELRTVLGVLREPEGAPAPLEPAPGLANIGELLQQARQIGLPARWRSMASSPRRCRMRSSLPSTASCRSRLPTPAGMRQERSPA